MGHRPLSAIAADLTATIDALPQAFLPSQVRDALTLSREFAAAVAERLADPPAPTEPPAPGA
jgi:hypothetical protein